jgi:RimJ/RimL family protein N-acetyltransferase
VTQIPTIETARLTLRPHRVGDFEAYAAMWTDPTVVRFIGGEPMSREVSWSRFLRQAGIWHHLGFGFFAIEDRATGAFAGECGFHDLHRAMTPSIEGTMETGWALLPAFHGQGLAEEAMRACLAWAEAHGTGDRLTAIIDPGNEPSLRLARRLGFAERTLATYRDNPIVLLARPRRGA